MIFHYVFDKATNSIGRYVGMYEYIYKIIFRRIFKGDSFTLFEFLWIYVFPLEWLEWFWNARFYSFCRIWGTLQK